jgi:hypothetical protein
VSGPAGRLYHQDQAQQPQAEVPPPSAAPITQLSPSVGNLNSAMGRGIDSRNRVWN